MTDVDQYIQAATRDNTRLSYRAAVEHFESQWGGFLPATADSVVRYLVDYANTLSVNTLRDWPAWPRGILIKDFQIPPKRLM